MFVLLLVRSRFAQPSSNIQVTANREVVLLVIGCSFPKCCEPNVVNYLK